MEVEVLGLGLGLGGKWSVDVMFRESEIGNRESGIGNPLWNVCR